MPIVAEILGGTLASSTWETNLTLVEQKLRTIRIWPLDFPAAGEYAGLNAELKRTGGQVPTIDLMIATIAMVVLNGTVVTTDSELSRVPGLRFEDWNS
jgi:tRNA(fMet)-specific endonuclease VapC